ncbi:MAG: hypothetical protein SGI86_00845 [Deltaproteobacteria bacterium]|nr:hypothetical protein [Deltaproteobacteria bacterium]
MILAFLHTPLAKLVKDVVTKWQFWMMFITLVVAGISLRQWVPASQREAICQAYKTYFAPKVEAALKAKLPTAEASTMPATEALPATMPVFDAGVDGNQLAKWVEDVFCDRAHSTNGTEKSHNEPESDPIAILPVVIPGSLVLSFLLCSLLPSPPKLAAAEKRLHIADELDLNFVELGGESDTGWIPGLYRTHALSTRQLRAVICYSLLSCAVTLLFPPSFVGDAGLPVAEENRIHFLGLAVVAVFTALYAAYIFSRSNFSTLQLAWKLGAGPLLIGGVASSLISLPYQIIRPIELVPLSLTQVRMILLIRLVIIPVVGIVTVFIFCTALRKLGRSIDAP